MPAYAFDSIVRMAIAYCLSLVFAISYGYIAAYNPRMEPWMIAVLDILQSIPVLSFLPPVVLAMVALIPGHQLGIEMGVILLIFTGQVWNLAFSFYSSLKTIPREMVEASRIYRYSAWQRFWQLEMPYAAIGLVWNSIVSVAGGWFALIFCETFTMGDRNFQLPGLGSYIQTATYSGDVQGAGQRHRGGGADRGGHRPADLAAADRVERQVQIRAGGGGGARPLAHPHPAAAIAAAGQRCRDACRAAVQEPIYRRLARSRECRVVRPLETTGERQAVPGLVDALAVAVAAAVGWGTVQAMSHAADVDMARPAAAVGGRCGDLSPRQCRAAHLRRMDDSGRGGHRPESEAGAHRAAAGADPGVGSGHCLFSGPAHRAGQRSAAAWASGPLP